MPPELSRFTIAFAVARFVGATVQLSPNVPLPVTGEPLTVKSEVGALSPTLLTAPVPGKACPGANVICPLPAMWRPVSRYLFDPCAKSRFRVPLAVLVLLFVDSACHWNVCEAAVPVELLYVEAANVKG